MIVIVLSIVFPVCLVLVLIGCLDCLFKKRRLQGFTEQASTNGRHSTAFAVDICDIPHTSEQVTIEPLPDILSKVSAAPQPLRPKITNVGRAQQDATGSFASVQRSFPRGHLTYLNEIGSGWFGKAIESEAVQILGGSYASHVVVKMLKDDASKLEQLQFLDEVSAFRNLENGNLIGFIGQCTETNPFLVVLEFAALGNLKSFLIQNNQEVDEMVAKNRFLSFALDAASGLTCLHKHDYIHNDLAARNCLVMSDYTLKIGDYGISDHLFKNEYYNTGTQLLPIRWMAPETLTKSDGEWNTRSFDKKSDMWSFGILLWEICSLGELPYNILTDEEVLQGVVLDRLVLPSDGDLRLPNKDGIWSIMVRCWRDQSDRPTVEQVYNSLEQLSRVRLDTMDAMQDFDQKWNQLKQNQGRTLSSDTDLGSRIALAGSFVMEGSPTSSEKSSPLDGELGILDRSRSDDIFIEIVADNAKAASGLVESVQPEPINLKQNTHTNVDGNLGIYQHGELSNISKHQVIVHVENELTKTSASPNFQMSTKQSDQSAVTATTPASISSQLLTTNETLIQPNNHNKDVKEFISTGTDLFLPIEAKTFPELLNENIEKPIKINDEISKPESIQQNEDEDFSDFVRTSPTAPSVDFTDFTSAEKDLSVKVERQDELKADKDTSSKVSNLASELVDSAADNTFSEFYMATGDNITAISDAGTFSDFVVSTPPSEAECHAIKEELIPATSSDTNTDLAESFVGKELPSTPEIDLMSSNLSPFSAAGLEPHSPNENISAHLPDSEEGPEAQEILSENISTNHPPPADISQEKVLTEKTAPDQNQNILSFENIPSLTSDPLLLIHDMNVETTVEAPSVQSNKFEDFTDLTGHTTDVTSLEPLHAQAHSVADILEESNTEIFQALGGPSSPFSSVDILEQSFKPPSEDSTTDETAVNEDDKE